MTILVTGVAGFIGFHCAHALLEQGEPVIGIDNMSDYYSVALKQDRLATSSPCRDLTFRGLDLADATH